MFKIGFDAKRLFNNFTGLGNYSRNLLHGLPANNPDFEFHLYTPSIKQDLISDAHNSDSFKIHLPSTALKSVWRSFGVTNDLTNDQIDLYHGLSNEIPFNFPTEKIKSVVTIHDLIFKIYPNTYPLLDRLIYNVKFKYACKNSNLILACSESTKKDICTHYQIIPEKIKVLYQTCNEEFLISKEAEFRKTILNNYNIPDQFFLYVGSIEPRKNLDTLIRAYALLPADLRLPLVFIGRNSKFKKNLLEIANILKVSKHLHFIHDLKKVNELSAVYQSASLFIYPSLYEGFGIPVIEAAFSKTAIITTNISSLPETGGPHCNYFNPNSPEDLCHQIEKLLSDEVFRKSSITNTYNYVQNQFNKIRIQEQLIKYYKMLLDNG